MTDSSLLLMNGIHKSFDRSVALDNVSFELKPAEIHGLLGGNGAGKTTLMNILFGLYRMDSGEIFLNDKKVNISSPRDALKLGVGMVHQHFLQIGTYPVLENIVLGTKIKRRFTMNLDEESRKIAELGSRFGLEVDQKSLIEDLPMGFRQKVEILKALYRGARILILDEPTTNLTPQEVDALFQSLRVMVKEGLSIVFITHKIREVLSVCDRITVLRNGKNALSLQRDAANEEAFVRGMVGEEMDIKRSIIFTKPGAVETVDAKDRKPALVIDKVSVIDQEGIKKLNDVSLHVDSHEIVGVAGVAGNGQRQLAECILGITPVAGGKISIGDLDVARMMTNELLEKGVAYIPEDRLHDGFLPKANVAQNLILGYHRKAPYSKYGFIDWKIVFDRARKLIGEYNVKTGGPQDFGGNLSGGNIQRVMIARAFSHSSRLLVAHNPTRGLDIPSMDFVYKRLFEGKKNGLATLLISEDLDELLLICDRIAVIYRGEILGILARHQFEKYEIGRMMSGIRKTVD